MWISNSNLFKNVFSVTILIVTIYSILPYPSPLNNTIVNIRNTTFWWILIFFSLAFFWFSKRYFFDIRNTTNLKVIKWYLLWNIFNILRGFWAVENYWDMKGLVENSMVLLLPIMVYIATNKEVVQSMLGFYYKFVLPLFIIFFFLIHPGAFGFYLVPIYLLAIFFPVLIFRWKIIVLFLTILVITINTDARSNVIKFSVPFLLLPIYYYRDFFTAKVLEKIRIFFVILPIFLFMLGAFGYFNIFKMDDYINQDFEATRLDDSGQMINTDMKADTRTGLYEEVLKSATMHNYYLIGRTPGRGNDSEIFSSYLQEITGKDERISNEVAILNVFTWTGIVGVILYFFIFFKASYLAVNRSKNIYSKMLGIFIAFRWSYAWVEDINNFSLTYFMLMILLGLCFSTSFRNMTDNGIYFWVRGIFDYRYRIFDKARKNSIKTAI